MVTLVIIVAAAGLLGLAAWVLRRSVVKAPEGYEDAAGFHFGPLPRRYRRRSATVRLIRAAKPAPAAVPPLEIELPVR